MRLTALFAPRLLAIGLTAVAFPALAGCLSAAICPVAEAAAAAPVSPFTPQAFAAAQEAGKPILVEIDASWCPTCAQQRPIVRQLLDTPEFRDVVAYRVDFDTQKDVVRQMGARMQSTLVVFHGRTEEGRSVRDTSEASIRALLAKAKG